LLRPYGDLRQTSHRICPLDGTDGTHDTRPRSRAHAGARRAPARDACLSRAVEIECPVCLRRLQRALSSFLRALRCLLPFVRFAANFTLFPARNSRAVDQRRRDVTPLVCHSPLTYFLPLPSLVIRYVATIDLSHSDRRVDRHLWKATRRRRVATKAHNIARITHSSGTPPNVGERGRDPKSAVRFEHSRIAP